MTVVGKAVDRSVSGDIDFTERPEIKERLDELGRSLFLVSTLSDVAQNREGETTRRFFVCWWYGAHGGADLLRCWL